MWLLPCVRSAWRLGCRSFRLHGLPGCSSSHRWLRYRFRHGGFGRIPASWLLPSLALPTSGSTGRSGATLPLSPHARAPLRRQYSLNGQRHAAQWGKVRKPKRQSIVRGADWASANRYFSLPAKDASASPLPVRCAVSSFHRASCIVGLATVEPAPRQQPDWFLLCAAASHASRTSIIAPGERRFVKVLIINGSRASTGTPPLP